MLKPYFFNFMQQNLQFCSLSYSSSSSNANMFFVLTQHYLLFDFFRFLFLFSLVTAFVVGKRFFISMQHKPFSFPLVEHFFMQQNAAFHPFLCFLLCRPANYVQRRARGGRRGKTETAPLITDEFIALRRLVIELLNAVS